MNDRITGGRDWREHAGGRRSSSEPVEVLRELAAGWGQGQLGGASGNITLLFSAPPMKP